MGSMGMYRWVGHDRVESGAVQRRNAVLVLLSDT
jgi:hypothetical protein